MMKPSILVVEDEEPVAFFLTELLEILGYTSVSVVGRADSAVQLLRSGPRPDLVITDLKTPGGSGLDVLRQAKSMDPPLPCIVCSGSWPDYRGQLNEAEQPDAILGKPFSEAQLAEAMRTALGATE